MNDKAQDQQLPPPATKDGVEIRPALEVLSRLRRGTVLDLLSVELNRVITGVKDCDSGKGGEVVLKLKIEPVKKHPNAVYIQAVITGKAPEDPPTSDVMFYDEDGNLFTRDPMQADIFDGPRSA